MSLETADEKRVAEFRIRNAILFETFRGRSGTP